MATSVAGWKDAIRSLLKRVPQAAGREPLFILMGEYSSDQPNHGTQIFEGMLAGIEEMSRRNPALINLSRRYVSTERPTRRR